MQSDLDTEEIKHKMRNKRACIDYMLHEKKKTGVYQFAESNLPFPLFPEQEKEKEKSALGWGER